MQRKLILTLAFCAPFFGAASKGANLSPVDAQVEASQQGVTAAPAKQTHTSDSKKFLSETMVGLSAVAIALSALGVSVWQGILTRQHNKLSVKPCLRFDWVSVPEQPITLLLLNAGIGPAIIESLRCFVDGTEVLETDDDSMLLKVRSLLDLDDCPFQVHLPMEDDAMSVGDNYTILAFTRTIDAENRRRIISALPRLELIVNYQSIYGDPFSSPGCFSLGKDLKITADGAVARDFSKRRAQHA